MAEKQSTWWTVIGNGTRSTTLRCRCVCGKEVDVSRYHLRHGLAKSCGCKRGTHRQTSSKTYRIWMAMRRRCLNHPNYVEKGTRVCQRWENDFTAFLADMGERPGKLEIDRRDNNGHYSCGKCPECRKNGWTSNCRWVTRTTQTRNTRQNVNLTLNGRTQCQKDWAKEYGLPRGVLEYRLKRGMGLLAALTKPLQPHPRRKQT